MDAARSWSLPLLGTILLVRDVFFTALAEGENQQHLCLLHRAPGPSPPPASLNLLQTSQPCRPPNLACCGPN